MSLVVQAGLITALFGVTVQRQTFYEAHVQQ